MARRVTRSPFIIQNENLGAHHKKAAFDGSIKSSKTAAKKDGVALRNRKALNDITNKTPLHQQVSSQKKNMPKEEFNVAEEIFLHDHKKCIEERETAINDAFWLDMVLPGHDSVTAAECSEVKQVKAEPDSPCCNLELEELSMSEFSDWFKSSTHCDSPPCSPISLDSPPSSPFSWEFKAVELVLKPENDVVI